MQSANCSVVEIVVGVCGYVFDGGGGGEGRIEKRGLVPSCLGVVLVVINNISHVLQFY